MRRSISQVNSPVFAKRVEHRRMKFWRLFCWTQGNHWPISKSVGGMAGVKLIAKRDRAKGARTNLLLARRRFLPVAHLWAARSIRKCQFEQYAEVGYDGHADFPSFLVEAENLCEWGQTWRAPRAKSKPPLPIDAWRVPENWTPPHPRPGWPEKLVLPDIKLPQELLVKLKPAGRPRKRG